MSFVPLIVKHKKKYVLKKANKELTDVSIKVNKIMAFMMPVMMLVMNLTVVGIIWFGGIRIDNGVMQIGDLMAFIQYVMQIMFCPCYGFHDVRYGSTCCRFGKTD